MWHRAAIGFAADLNMRRVPKAAYQELFDKGLTPRDAAAALKGE